MPGTGSTTSISITISTPCGSVSGQWRPSNLTRAAAILLPDEGGSLGGPFHLFDDLAASVQRSGASVLQLERCSDTLDGRLVCLLSALTALRRQGVQRMVLIGWHTGASLAIAAGSASDDVTGVAALAPDASAADYIAEISPRRLLLMHGSHDMVVSSTISRLLYARAADPKELVVFPGEQHDFSVFHEETLDKLTAWTRGLLRSPFKPRRLRREIVDAQEVAPIESDAPVALPSTR